MVRTKQTPRGSASHRPGGMTTAKFTGMGRGKAGPEEQFIDAPEEDTEEDLPLVLEDAVRQPKEGKPGASKSKGKKLAQATEGAEAPPEETPLDPQPPKPSKSKGEKLAEATEGADAPPEETPPDPQLPKPHTEPAPVEPQPGTSQAPAEDPTLTRMNHQLLLSMSRRIEQQAKLG